MKHERIDLGDRRKYLGWSEIGTALGYDKYMSPYQLARRKLGMDDPTPGEVEAQEMGHLLEPIIAERYAAKFGYEIWQGKEVVHPELPWLRGHPDFLVHSFADEPSRYLECKTTGIYEGWGSAGTDDVPKTAFCQGFAGTSIMQLDFCDFGLLRVPTRPEYFWCARDDELWKRILQETVAFWGFIERRELPPPDRVVDFKIAFPAARKGHYKPYDHETLHERFERYVELTAMQGGLEKEKEKIKEASIVDLGEFEGYAIVGEGDPEPVVTYSSKKQGGKRRFLITPRGQKLFAPKEPQ